MPTYDYRCKACDHAFELVQSMSAPIKRKCPACAKLQLERLIGAGAGFFVKGKATPPKTPPKTPPSVATSSSSSSSSSRDATTPAKDTPKAETTTKADKPATDKPEKRISGGTSTPTHKAREGRGVGNLVDRAKRMAKPSKKAVSKPAKRSPKQAD